ncbi:unnamed protein product [Peniophora sp. CBMAI 1063]|nr:unnamed protein product [Peniophora sp. CBMAI 1063]
MDRAAPAGSAPASKPARDLSNLKFNKKTLPPPPTNVQRPPKRPLSPTSSHAPPPALPAEQPAERRSKPPGPLKKLPLDFQPKLATLWGDNHALVCVNTDYAPGDPTLLGPESVYTCDDGNWGWHDPGRQPQFLDPAALYLAFTPVPDSADSDMTRLPEFREPRKEDTVRGTNAKGRAQDNVFISRDEVHKELEERAKTLEKLFRFAVGLFHEAMAKTEHGKTTVQHRVAAEIRPPYAASSIMRRTWGTLRWGELQSWADYMVCARMHQRSSAFVTAYIDFMAAFLPREQAKMLRLRIPRRAKTSRRGVIVSGTQIDTYLRFLVHLSVPVYALVDLNEYSLPDGILYEHMPPRCSVVPSIPFTDIRQKDLPLPWYPPQGIDWRHIEFVAFHGVPIPGSAMRMSDRKEADLARMQGKARAAKKQKVEGKLKEADFREHHPGVDISAERYKLFADRAPALNRFYDLKQGLRDMDIPQARTAFLSVEAKALEHVDLLDKYVKPPDGEFRDKKELKAKRGDGTLGTWTPPMSVLYRAKTHDTMIEHLLYATWLAPTFLARVRLARNQKDKNFRRLRPNEWRDVLSTQAWQRRW